LGVSRPSRATIKRCRCMIINIIAKKGGGNVFWFDIDEIISNGGGARCLGNGVLFSTSKVVRFEYIYSKN
jgi:hypothetical protein